ncbi:hypothetical protein [Pseudomonas aestiva]|uniref:hypothetical protein n=1 Tax=Pseudomonas aestiva TaxID=3136739 RepID=UPI003263463C
MSIKSQIIALLEQGLGNVEIVQRLGCAPSYPALLRQQLGMPSTMERGTREAIVQRLTEDPTRHNVAIAELVGCAATYVWRVRKSLGLPQHHIAAQERLMAPLLAATEAERKPPGRKPKAAPLRDEILAYLASHPRSRVNDVAQALGTNPATVCKAKAWAARRKSA